MARFWTEAEVDLSVEDIYENLSDRELNKLIDLLVEEGDVISVRQQTKNDTNNFLDDEWKYALVKLINNRHRLTTEQEEIIHQIASNL